MEVYEAVILGLIQGIAEWLPISSSGHLVLGETLLGVVQPVAFDVFLHLASLIIILVVFWKDIVELTKGFFAWKKKYVYMALFLVIGSLPIAIVGLLFGDYITSVFKDLRVVGFGLLFTALLLYMSGKIKRKKNELSTANAFTIGVAQAIAIFPGVSRSGSTISTAMMLGIKKEEAAKFSFLMFIPAIIGATIFEFNNMGGITDVSGLVIAFLVTLVSGYFALKWLLKVIKKGKFSYFAVYCLVLGLVVLGIAFL